MAALAILVVLVGLVALSVGPLVKALNLLGTITVGSGD